MLVEFREQLVASKLMTKEDVNELETLNGLELKNKLVSTGILEETDVTALNGSGKKASSKKESGAEGSSAQASSKKESSKKESSEKESGAEGSGAKESAFAITLTKLKDILVDNKIIEEAEVAGLDDSGLKEKLLEKEILEEADVITLRKPESTKEPISLDFLEELKKFVEKVSAYSISDGKSRSIFDDEDGKEIYDYVIGERDVTPKSQAHLAVRRRIVNDAKNTIKNSTTTLKKIDHKLANSPKYQILATDENFIGLKDLVDKVYSDILKSETQDQEGPTYPDEVFEPYKYSDPLIEYNLSQEENEDKAVEILLKATAGAGFEFLDEVLEITENNKSLINDHLSYNLMTFKLKKFKRVSDPITIVCKKDEECKPAILIEVDGKFKRKTYEEDEIDGEPEIKPYMTDVEIKKARELVRSNGEKVKGFAEDILNSLPEDWKNEFRDKYDVI